MSNLKPLNGPMEILPENVSSIDLGILEESGSKQTNTLTDILIRSGEAK